MKGLQLRTKVGVYLLKITQFRESSSYLDFLEISHMCMQGTPVDPTPKRTLLQLLLGTWPSTAAPMVSQGTLGSSSSGMGMVWLSCWSQ